MTLKTTEKLTSGRKDQIYWKILNTALRLEMKKGHLKWSLTEVSRLSGVSRPLIYYYFGKDKEALLTTAIATVGEEIIGTRDDQATAWAQGQFAEGLSSTRQAIASAPYLIIFYLTQRQQGALYQKEILKLERKFLARVKKFSPNAKDEGVMAVYAMALGCMVLDDLSDSTLALLGQTIALTLAGKI